MSHYIYQTEAIVLSKRNFGEAEQFISFYTKEFGNIRATARGVRLLKSKLRSFLDNLSFVKIGLVQGREFWRVVDASEMEAIENIKGDPAKFFVLSKIGALLNRLAVGEEKNYNLWRVLSKNIMFLDKTLLDSENLKNFEIITVLNMLKCLGYARETNNLKPFLGEDINLNMLVGMGEYRREALSEIKKALSDSHL